VALPSFFSDNMVLQQGMQVPIWGRADDGEMVEVSFQGQTAAATARDGKWMVHLNALKLGGPFEMTVSGKNTIVIRNVLVGEVWVCGGQSNIAMQVSKAENSEADIAASDNPMIRLFKVEPQTADAPMDDVVGKWKICSPETVSDFSATGYFFGRELQKARSGAVGLISSCAGGTKVRCWIPRVEQGQTAGRPPRAKRPHGYYYGMIAPLQPYAIRGVIWYQGEANSHGLEDALQYHQVFSDMIRCWRKEWGQGDFPFLFVQMPGFAARGRDWRAMRESQAKTLALPKTGMAVTIDVGTKTSIHPRKKQAVGTRLALVARAVGYGENIEFSGPVYRSMEKRGDKIVLRFDHVDGGLEARGGELKGFVIAGEDAVFVNAVARIDGDAIVVSSPHVAAPQYVRYAWANWPDVSLYNKEGLPAPPFRTDDFPFTQDSPNPDQTP
jgi:sialate O-acetylesterase